MAVANLAIAGFYSQAAQAHVFTIQSATSFVTLSGSDTSTISIQIPPYPLEIDSETASVQPQGPGSLTSSLTGTINAEVIGNSISFLSGSSIVFSNNGNWLPYGTPANAGGYFQLAMSFPTYGAISLQEHFAIRNAMVTFNGSASLSEVGGNLSFPVQGLSAVWTNGIVDYQIGGSLFGFPVSLTDSEPLTLYTFTASPTTGTLISDGSIDTLTIPFDLTYINNFYDSGDGVTITETLTARITGTVVAVHPVPEPSNWVMLLSGLGLVGLAVRRG